MSSKTELRNTMPPAAELDGRPHDLPARKRLAPFIVAGVGLAVVLFFSLRYLVEVFTHESTDDAFIEASIVALSPKVSGIVSGVHVDDNQAVRKGDPLVDIDPRDYETTLTRKQAALQVSASNLKSVQAGVVLMTARLATAEASASQAASQATASQATADRAAADFKRAETLLNQGAASPQEFDQAQATTLSARATAAADRDKALSEKSRVAEAGAQVEAARAALDMVQAQIRQAQADAKTAELDLSYTRLFSPVDGVVTRKAVHAGEYVQVGQRLLAVVPHEVWVVANFKETQLDRIRTNQPVAIHVDAYPDRIFAGHVDSIQSGSGARFSLLPPENAVGNFVKVVQRVPVKILFDAPPDGAGVLGPGMSVVPSVEISRFTVSPERLALAAAVLSVLATGLVAGITMRRKPNGATPAGVP